MNEMQIEEETDTIRELELEAFKLSNELNVFIEEARRIKAEATMEVEIEYDTTGDKALSNQTKRNAEADTRLVKNEYYTTLLTDISEIGTILKELAINIAYEKRQFTRSTNHIDDLHDIRASLNLISKDFHAFTMHTLYPVIKYEQETKSTAGMDAGAHNPRR